MTYPPRAMKCTTAAAYCDATKSAFLALVAAGELPPPFDFGGRDYWNREALDKALDAKSGAYVDNAEQEFWNRAKKTG